MALTPHQEEKKKESLDILADSNRLVLQGKAGVGKTYLINSLIKDIPSNSILVSAPTHKAVEVIRGKIDEDLDVELATIHSILRLKRRRDKKGKIKFVPSFKKDNPPLKGIRYLFIDESSMIGSDILQLIEHYATKARTKVIFIGDGGQINPVGEDYSPVFEINPETKEPRYPTVTITEIVRQGKGNPIIDLSRNLKLLKGNKSVTIQGEGNKLIGYLFTNNKERIIERLAEVNGTDKLKYLAWTNKKVNEINSLVRKKIYKNPNKIELDETLIFDTPYGPYKTNQEVKVKTLSVNTLEYKHLFYNYDRERKILVKGNDIPMKLKVYCINENEFVLGEGYPSGILVIHEDSTKDYDLIRNNIELQCKMGKSDWELLDAFENIFAYTKYNHAITVHKSQGSTYERAVIDEPNISKNFKTLEKERLFYTGVTRASDLVIVLK